MRKLLFWAIFSVCAQAADAPDTFEHMKAMVGQWDADLPGVGKLSASIRLISNGRAIEETIGTPADNEVSVYTRNGNGVVLTHFCAMTPDGHQARLETGPLTSVADSIIFAFHDAVNLHSPVAPHMRKVVITLVDASHLSEKWTKTENGKDTVFDLNFVRR